MLCAPRLAAMQRLIATPQLEEIASDARERAGLRNVPGYLRKVEKLRVEGEGRNPASGGLVGALTDHLPKMSAGYRILQATDEIIMDSVR